MDKEKRDFERQLEIKYNGYVDEFDYKDAKKTTFSNRDLYDGIAIGEMTIDISKFPKQEDYRGLLKAVCDKLTDEEKNGRYVAIKRVLQLGYNSYPRYEKTRPVMTLFSFYRLEKLWKKFEDNPDTLFPLYDIKEGLYFTLVSDKVFIFPEKVVTSYRLFEEARGIETTAEDTSHNQLVLAQKQLSTKVEEARVLEEEIFAVDNFHTPELNSQYEAIEQKKAELEAMISDMYSLQSKMRAEIMARIENMHKELFFMETNFYSMICRWGEAVHFDRLKSGEKAPLSQPLVVQQKTVYLYEDLPRLKHFINQEAESFEELLATSPKFVERISPNDKSITFVKNQRVDGVYASTDRTFLEFIPADRPSAVGILVRDGENIYLGWTDANKIQIPEDSFASQTTQEEAVSSLEEVMKKSSTVSRYFILNILIGLIESHNALIQFDVIPHFTRADDLLHCPQIIFANADNQIATNRYPSLKEYMELVSPFVRVNEPIYVLARMQDGYRDYWGGGINVNRGKGNSNRTENAVVNTGFSEIRSIEYDSLGNKLWYVPSEPRFHWSDNPPKPSFKLYPDEFVNLTYLTQDMIEEWLSNKNIGNVYIDFENLSFEYLVSHLLKMQELLKERFAKWQTLIPSKYFNENLVTSFQAIKGVRELTEYQVKRYVKWVDTLSEDEKSFYSDYAQVVKELPNILSKSHRSHYVVGFVHPEKPIFFSAQIDEYQLYSRHYKKHYATILFSAENGNSFSGDITTFGAKKKAQELCDWLNDRPRIYKLAQEQGREIEDDEKIDTYYSREEKNYPKNFTGWKVFEVSQLKAIYEKMRNE